jgi:hypothetical protein
MKTRGTAFYNPRVTHFIAMLQVCTLPIIGLEEGAYCYSKASDLGLGMSEVGLKP